MDSLKELAKEIAHSSCDITFQVFYNKDSDRVTWEEFPDGDTYVTMNDGWMHIGKYAGARGTKITQTAIRNRIAEDIRNADGIISSRRHVW